MACDCLNIERLRVRPGDVLILRFPEHRRGEDYQHILEGLRVTLNKAGHHDVPGIVLIGDIQLNAVPRAALEAAQDSGTPE